MAKKSPSRKSLKSLFSKSEASLNEPAAKDVHKTDGEKKRFKFPKFKSKSKSGPASEKSANGSQQVLSAAEPKNTALAREAWADDIVSDRKKSFLYSTTPRSKAKEISYSELDLRKPKRFATFSFGLRKRKKKDDENISKSSYGLHSPGIEEQEDETRLDLSQIVMDQSNMKLMMTMSQPELDTSDTFDIPSPPPAATNQAGPYFPILHQSQRSVSINTEQEPKEHLKGDSDLWDLQKEMPKAPIASIPELQLDDEKLNVPIHGNSSKSDAKSPVPMTHAESISAVDTQTAPSLPARQPPIMPDALGNKTAVVNLVYVSNDPCDNDVPRQSHTTTDMSLTESTSVTLSSHQHDAPDTADSTAPGGKPCLTSVDSKTAITASTPVPHGDDNPAPSADSATIHEHVSVSHTEGSIPEAAGSDTTAVASGSENSARPYSQERLYGALYDSLFPESFTSEIMSSLSNPPHQICTEVRHLISKSEPVMIKTRDECHTEIVTHSRLLPSRGIAAHRIDDGERAEANIRVVSSIESSSFISDQCSAATVPQTDTDIHLTDPPSSVTVASEAAGEDTPHAELTRSHSGLKSHRFSLIGETGVVAPPVSDCVTSQGMNAQVTDSKQRVILVKELVTDEASADSGCPSPVPDKMSVINETPENFYAASGSGQMECERPLSPVYLSVGSDDGSAMEIYYSAEEDNAEETGEEEMYTIEEKEDVSMVDDRKEVEREEIPEKGGNKREEGHLIVIVKMQDERGNTGNEEKKEDLSEVHQYLRGQRSETGPCEFLVSNDAKSQEREAATTMQLKDEGEEERKEELLATPVQQVMVCEVAPPSSEQHGQGEGWEGNWTEDHLYAEKQLPGQETRYQAYKDIKSSECVHTASTNAGEEEVIPPTAREAEEQVSLPEDKRGEGSKESTDSNCDAPSSAATDACAGAEAVTGLLTCGAELQSDATESGHKRAQQSSEGVETSAQSTDEGRTEQEQVAVELSASNADTHPPGTKPAEALPETQPDLDHGSRTNTAASEVIASESQQTEDDQEVVDKMNSGYSSLSTKLTIKSSSPPKEDDPKQRFRKVSLITEADGPSQDTEDISKTSTTVTELNGSDVPSEYRWRNRFDGVSQYKPEDSSSSDSLSYTVSDTYLTTSSLSSSSALREATAYKHLSDTNPSPTPSSEELFTLGHRLSDRVGVYLSQDREPVGEPKDKGRRSLVEQEEPGAPAGEREGEAESERIKSRWDSQQLPVSDFSVLQTSHADRFTEHDEASQFTGLFKATLVDLVADPAAPPSTPPASPDIDSPNQFDMDSLVDTLKSMGPSLRPRATGLRAPPQALVSSLPPIVEDAPSPVTADVSASLMKKMEATGSPTESSNGVCSLPPDLGLKWSTPRDTRSPLELMKQNQQEPQSGTRGLNLPLRASATNSIVMRKSSDSSPEDLKSPVLNGNGLLQSPSPGSRLDNSVIFGSYRSPSLDQTVENGKAQRSFFRASSLPETGLSNDRMSVGLKEPSEGSRFERFSFLLNSSSSASGSLTGAEDPNSRMSRPPPLGITSPPPSSNSPTRLLSPSGSIDIHRSFTTTDSPLSLFGQTQGLGMGVGTGSLGAPILQRSFSSEGTMGVQQTSLFNSMHGGSVQSKEPEPDRNLASKYRAFPDAYLTKEKEHGKLNPRPGKMYIFDRPGMCGQRIEVRSDVIDATPWELQETISIRVVRGGWVLYEKPNFKGEKIALDEGDIEITYPFNPPEEQQQNGQKEGEQQNGETSTEQTKPAKRFIIGSIRRAVRDYSVPEISLFPEENAEGKKVIFRDTSDDARIFGFPIKANSIIINAGLWLVYAQPFFQGVPRVLEVGGYSNPAAWGVEQPYVGSLHPLKVGEPRVENLSEPQMVIYEKPYFTGKSRTITTNMRDFMTRIDRQQSAFMYNVGSLKVLGGIWVGYEKEGFRGHQYLLEEGEYHDWRVWGGHDAELRSVRVIRAELTDPLMMMFEHPEEEQEGMQEENTFEVTEAIPDVELFGYKTSTRSIQVISGAWIAYSHVDFSGHQYILEKGFYNNCADWGSQDTRICSVQPILLAPSDISRARNEIIIYSEPDFQGECHIYDRNQEAIQERFLTKSCRVVGGSWTIHENEKYSGNMYVLTEGDYPNLSSMGCPTGCTIRSTKVIPLTFSVPSISLFGLEGLEGREITTEAEILSMTEEGFNNHILSLRVNSGCWVICEHSNYRGRQFLLEPIEITNWPKFSSINTIGSVYPVRQKRHFFRIKNKERGLFMAIQGGVEEMKSGRVVVTAETEPMSNIWFYQDGLIKNKLSPTMSLQVMGNIEPAAKVVLWTETRQPIQTWTARMRGLITSLTFPGMVLDVKGGKTYDKDHVVIMPENEERAGQQWEIELL